MYPKQKLSNIKIKNMNLCAEMWHNNKGYTSKGIDRKVPKKGQGLGR